MVSLKEEVLHIEEYIELEKIRFQDSLKVQFNTTEINENIKVAPMLLIPFVENAFKHGSLVDGYLQIKIDVEVKQNRLDFSIQNSFIQQDVEGESGGIGLKNIQKRLDLNYPGLYNLSAKIEDKVYVSKLNIIDLTALKHDE
jgi:LytS/YehU family sensor histidine kinase